MKIHEVVVMFMVALVMVTAWVGVFKYAGRLM